MNKKKTAIGHQSFTQHLWITLCVTTEPNGKVLDP